MHDLPVTLTHHRPSTDEDTEAEQGNDLLEAHSWSPAESERTQI